MGKLKTFILCSILLFFTGTVFTAGSCVSPRSSGKTSITYDKHTPIDTTQSAANTSTLPQGLAGRYYYQHIASVLGWTPTDDPSNLCHGFYAQPDYIKNNPTIDQHAPIQITAQGPATLRLKGVSVLRDHVVVRQPGRILYADKVYIFRHQKTDKIYKIVLIGHVRAYESGILLVNDKSIVTLYPKTVSFFETAYHYYSEDPIVSTIHGAFNAWGTATRGDQSADDVTTIHDATYSTCAPNSAFWTLSAHKIVLDKPNNVGKAYGGVLRLGRVPVFYLPYYSFPLNNARKTGFLFPIFGSLSQAGFYTGVPFYVNLATNYDLLLTPEYYGLRGFRGIANFRYLTNRSHGTIDASYLPDDRLFGQFRQNALQTYSNTALYPSAVYQPYLNELQAESNHRGYLSMENYTQVNAHLSTELYLDYVTDPYYFADIYAGGQATGTTTNQLLNLFTLHYSNEYWDLMNFLQAYQTLHIVTQIQEEGQALDQYRRLPDLDAYGYFPVTHALDVPLYMDYTNFAYDSILPPSKPTGQRFHLRPGFNLAFENSSAYLKPAVWLDAVDYQLGNTIPGTNTSSDRVLPIVDVDSGLYFLRHFDYHDSSYTQTFQPRLFYLYVPYANQNGLPNFDTIQLPFFFDQLFSLNTFTGVDRIENANQFSLGLTTSILQDATGQQILKADFGGSYYLSQPRVCLTPGCSLTERSVSPLIGDLTFYPSNEWSLSGSIAYDPKYHLTDNAAATIGYHSQDGHHVFNLTYLYVGADMNSIATFTPTQTLISNNFVNTSTHLIFNFTWPLSSQWSTLGYTDYDLRLKRVVGVYAGLQYDSCCWALRFIIKNLLTSSTLNAQGALNNSYDTGYFIEFTLKGLGNFGSGTDALVESLVPGYKP